MTEKYKSLETQIRETRRNYFLENTTWEIELDEVIVNSNSCGQGHDADHDKHEHHDTILKHGYRYSHSTPVRYGDGTMDAHTVIHHTYKHVDNEDKNVSVHKPFRSNDHRWDTSTSGSGRQATMGVGTTGLEKHLKTRKVTPKAPHQSHNDIKEEVEVDEAKIKAMGWTKNKLDKWVHPDHPGYGNGRAKNVIEDLPDLEKLRAKKAAMKKEEVEVDEATKKSDIDAIGKYHSDRMNKWSSSAGMTAKSFIAAGEKNPDSKYHAVMRNRAMRLKHIRDGTGQLGPTAMLDKTGKGKGRMEYATADSKEAKKLKTPYAPMKQEEVEPVEELANPVAAKLDAQRQQIQKQKQAAQAELHRQKAAKTAQDVKDKAAVALELSKNKIKEEEELNERHGQHVHTFERAAKLLKLHSQLYSKLSAAGNLAAAEVHRKRANEYKRIAYAAHDNPGKLPGNEP